MSAFFGDGTLHAEHQKGENDADHGKDQEAVKIRKRQGLLVAQVRQGLQGHLLRADRITGLLEVAGLGLGEEGSYGRVQGIEILAESQA